MNAKERLIRIHISLILSMVAIIGLSGCVTSQVQDVLTGTVSFAEENISFFNATAYVKIMDLSIADPSSRVVAEQKISNLSINNGTNNAFQYLVPTSKLEEGKEYSLSVHIDVDGDGTISEVDYIIIQHYPLDPGLKTLDVVVHKFSGGETAIKVLTEEQNGASADMEKGELITIRLEENPTTGYSWNMSFTDGLEIIKDEFIPSTDTGLVGAGGVHEWTIRTNSSGQYHVLGIYKRPWENVTGNENAFNLTLNISS